MARREAAEIDVITCGTVQGYIDFEGIGTLKGVGGRRADFGNVRFRARAVAAGEPGEAGRLYLRVYNETGETLLLISGNSSNPTDIAPAIISTGNIRLHDSGCD